MFNQTPERETPEKVIYDILFYQRAFRNRNSEAFRTAFWIPESESQQKKGKISAGHHIASLTTVSRAPVETKFK